MDETHLDRAHAEMEEYQSDTARMRFYEVLAASELFLLLEAEVDDDQVIPQAFELEGQAFVLAFDTEGRLAEFAGAQANYVALSGRAMAEMIAVEKLGLALNLDVAPSAIVLPPEAMEWLYDAVSESPDQAEVKAQELHAPKGLPENLLMALDTRLASMEGLAVAAYLAAVTYEDGSRGHLLGFVDAMPGAEDALAQAVSEVLRFSGVEAAVLDVGFFRAADPIVMRFSMVGLKFELPTVSITAAPRPAPGSDPDNPPKLR
ncbi:MAG: SseB family protein [Pseudomonadota bacterium]